MKSVFGNFNKYLIFVPIILSAAVLLYRIDKPFIGHHDFIGAFEGMITRNWLQYGILQTKLGAIPGHLHVNLADYKSYYTDQQPLLPIMVYFSLGIFGVHEWAIRIIPALFSIVGVTYFYLICQKLWGQKVATLASVFYILNPMYIYFGKMPAPGILALPFSLAGFYYYLKWLEKGEKKLLLTIYLIVFLGGLADWTMGIFAGLLVLHNFIIHKFRKELLYIIPIYLLTILLMLFHSFILTGQFITQETLSVIKFRLTDKLTFGGVDYSFKNFLRQEISWLQTYFTRIMIILSGLYLVTNMRSKFDLPKSAVLFYLGFALIYTLVFKRYIFIHDFLNIYWLPFLAMAAALGLKILVDFLIRLGIHRLVVWAACGLIIFLFISERIEYTKTLLAGQMNKSGLEMAQQINSLQNEPNQVAVISPRFASFYGIFTDFYSRYPYWIMNEDDLKKGQHPQYIIMIDQDITDHQLYNQFIGQFRSQRKNDLTIIDTNAKL